MPHRAKSLFIRKRSYIVIISMILFQFIFYLYVFKTIGIVYIPKNPDSPPLSDIKEFLESTEVSNSYSTKDNEYSGLTMSTVGNYDLNLNTPGGSGNRSEETAPEVELLPICSTMQARFLFPPPVWTWFLLAWYTFIPFFIILICNIGICVTVARAAAARKNFMTAGFCLSYFFQFFHSFCPSVDRLLFSCSQNASQFPAQHTHIHARTQNSDPKQLDVLTI